MALTERIRNRIDALFAILKPANSLASRVDALSEDDRQIYDRYSDRMKDFIARNDIDENGERGNAWARSIEGYGPHLPDRIYSALFGTTPQILKTDTNDIAARKYDDCRG